MAGVSRNRPAPARPYDNSRRAEQAQENRARILDAALALLAEDSELNVPEVAGRAGVSVPTVYRNFPTRDALLEAVDAALTEKLGAPAWPRDPAAFAGALPALHDYFERNGPLLRAASRRRGLKEVVAHAQRKRDRAATAPLADAVAHLAPDDRRAVVALVRILAGSDVWLALRDRFAIPPAVTGRAVGWALAQLLRGLADDARAGVTELAPAEVSA